MRCELCRSRSAPAAPDPRLPLLRVTACWRCRDRIASFAGWFKHGRSPLWQKGSTVVEVRRPSQRR